VLQRYRHAYLLASLMLLLFASPFIDESGAGVVLLNFTLAFSMVTSILASSETKRQAVIGLIFASLMQVVFLYRFISGVDYHSIYSVIGLGVFAYLALLMMRKIFLATPRVTADTIYGALSIYMILGVLWTFAYTLLENLEPGSFNYNGSIASATFDRFIGFSFITLTTLGYGNVVPTNPRADALTALEAVVGQVYLTVLLARLVALQLTQAREE
jgi:hypothetical protein